MVSLMPNQTTAPELGFDRVFRALADPTRLAVVERLGRGPAATSELAEAFDMALPSFLQHLRVLEECGLATSSKQGRVRTYRLTPGPLREAEDWLSAQRDVWERRLDRLDDHLHEMKKETP
jgi:DNA-binding transcriptional ArsR family regulator